MSLLVQKYGGSSLASPEHLQRVAKRIAKATKEYDQVIIIVSAMGETTNQLLHLAEETTSGSLDEKELDALLSTGEMQSTHLLALALNALQIPAEGIPPYLTGIEVEGAHGNARIKNICTRNIRQVLQQGKVAIIPGFQGIRDGIIYTLGRGGSDLTAIALASKLKAAKCQILTDVDGVYTVDPRLIKNAKKIKEISYDEMLELSSSGTKVMQSRAVEIAKKFGIDFEVSSSFNEEKGTLVKESANMEGVLIRGVSAEKKQARVTVSGIDDSPGSSANLLNALTQIYIDMIVVNVSGTQKRKISFTINEKDLLKVMEKMEKFHGSKNVETEKNLSKISIVGAGMLHHSGIAQQMFKALGQSGINIGLVSTSEIKISVTIQEKETENALRILHKTFSLHKV